MKEFDKSGVDVEKTAGHEDWQSVARCLVCDFVVLWMISARQDARLEIVQVLGHHAQMARLNEISVS